MSQLTVDPDPPKIGAPFILCFEWSPPSPGGSVDVSVEYLPAGGSISVPFTCPWFEPYRDCVMLTPPQGAKGFTAHPTQMEAPDLSRMFLD